MAVHGVLVTYHRPVELASMLEQLGAQSLALDTLVIVDNGDAQDPAPLVGSGAAREVAYLHTGDNLGPAGGLHVGSAHALVHAAPDDWVLFLDDDDPPASPDAIEALHGFAERQLAADPSTGAVGLVGGRLDRRRGSFRRVADDELSGAVPVDYVGGGQLPLYRAAGALAGALPEPALFFGFDDLDVGLRLGATGHRLYCDGGAWLDARRRSGRLGLGDVGPTWQQPAPTWRTYYSHRNLVHILRTQGMGAAAARRAATVVGKAVANLPRSPRTLFPALRQTTKAVLDGWRGRLGRTVEPG